MQKRVASRIWHNVPRRPLVQDGITRFSRKIYTSLPPELYDGDFFEDDYVPGRRHPIKTGWRGSANPMADFYRPEYGPKRPGLRLYDPSGRMTYFDAVFLRDSCRCPDCVDLYSGNKKFYTAEIPSNIRIREVELSEPNPPEAQLMRLTWMHDVEGYSPGHVTYFQPAQLVKDKKKYGGQILASSVDPLIGSSWEAKDTPEVIKTFSYGDIMEDGYEFSDAIYHLKTYGLIFVGGVPESEKSVINIGERIGPLKNTFYGYTWDVKDKPKAENVAYTSGFLGLHMDLLYMKQPPGLQLLHCIRSSEEGGESIFADSFAAARKMRDVHRVQFDYLAQFQVPYHYYKGGHNYFDAKPTFDLGRAPGLHYTPKSGNMGALTLQNVNYSPPFQAQFDYRALEDTIRLRSYSTAIGLFHGLVSRRAALYERRLEPGECVIFNNRRILHGRHAFTSAGERFLKGAYIDSDPFDSLVTRLKKEGRWLNPQKYGSGRLEQSFLESASMVGQGFK